MKVIFNFFNKIITMFWGIIDKLIVIPISKLIMIISKRFDNSGKNFENWLSKPNTILYISLFLAITIFIAIDQKWIVFSENSAEVIKNQTVNVVYNEEAYVVDGIPETVDITLIGRRAELVFAKQSSTHDVNIDLTGLKPGTHKVNINYKQAMPSIEYSVNPAVATIVIYPKVSVTKTLTIDLLNQDSLSERLVISDISISSDRVIIKGAEQQLAKVAAVKALVDVKNLVNHDIGTITLRDVPLVAYDNKGNIVGVEIVPNKITATVTIESPSKEVPIRIIPKGELGFGKAISSVEMSETKIMVFANNDILNNLNYIEVEVDVTDLKENRQYKMEIPKPVGVKTMSINNITVDITLGDSTDKEIENVNIEYRNLNDIYTVQGMSQDDVLVLVGLKGVASVLEGMDSEDVIAYLDLAGYGEGEHEVDVKVEGTDPRVTYIAKTKKVKIRIEPK